MRFLVLTNPGLEETSIKEIKKISKISPEKKKSHLIIESKSREEIYKLAYSGRSFTRILEILDEKNNPFELDFTIPFSKKKNIGIEIMREGNHEFNTEKIYKITKEKTLKQGFEIKKNNPDIALFVLSKDEKAYFCIDYSGFDLGKRDYKIFINKSTLKGNIAAGILMLAGFEKENSLLDPFCRDGTIAIEAALITKNQSLNYYRKEKFSFLKTFDEKTEILDRFDKIEKKRTKIIASDKNFANISSAKKNAVICSLRNDIRFLKCAIDEIDLKFDKEIDYITTMPLQEGKAAPEKLIEKTAEQFFHRAKETLSEKGKIVLALKKSEEIYKKKSEESFFIDDEKEIMQGKEKIKIIIFKIKK
jgi:23S rRNA G2445 N2-methylase RlmL